MEKSFDCMNNDICMDSLLTHNAETMEGKLFTSFISLILWSHMQKQLRISGIKVEKTTKRMILPIQKINTIEYAKGAELLEPLTRKQKDILGIFGINEGVFTLKLVR